MSALIEAARSAMQALYGYPYDDAHWKLWFEPAADNLREALAAAEAQPVGEPVAPHPSAMKRGGRYNWKGQPERLEYLGKKGSWHQFAKVGRIGEVWCEVLGGDLHMLEETAPPVQPAAPLTDEQIQALVLATVYDGDCSTPHRDAWAAEIGVPFARAIERAHGIGSQP